MESKKPVKKFRHGRVSVAVWRNEHAGEPFYTCSFTNSYKDKETDDWRDSSSYNLWDVFSLLRCGCDAAAFLTLPEVAPEEPSVES